MPANVTVISHPLVQHKLSLMRDVSTTTSKFRTLLREISLLLTYEICRDLETEMVAAGVRVFVGGLTPPAQAKTIRSGGGATRVIDGPFIEAKEVVGGFWVLELADMDEALAWGRKAVVACRAPVEVRAFN